MKSGEICLIAIDELKPHPGNARTHTKKQILQIAKSIKTFGFTNPVLVDEAGNILAGHGRIEAAKQLGMESVPAIRLGDMTEPEKRAYIIADNRLAELAGWDRELLAVEFQYITELDLDFDLTLTGFETADIDLVFSEYAEDGEHLEEDEVPVVDPAEPPVTRTGDLWRLGRHRLLCGDARDPGAYRTLLEGASAQLVFTDPPYNVPIDGHVSGLGAIKHGDFQMACGEMDREAFTEFLSDVFQRLVEFSCDGSIHYIFMDWRHMVEVLAAGEASYGELKNVCVWNKTNAGMGTFYRSKHELVFVFKNGSAPHINNFELGQHGRYRTNVWDYAGANALHPGRMDELRMHPTVKPIALVADAIMDCSRRGGIVLDPFAGSGTTLVAAERTDRRCYALELDPMYVDVAVRRWQQLTGEEAVHEQTGRPYDAVAAGRTNELEGAAL